MDLVEQINSAYAHDIDHRFLPTAIGEIPLTYEAITDDWLSDVLCRDVPGAEVSSHQLGPVDDGSWNRRRITLQYNDVGVRAALPRSVFCKASQSLENRMVLGVSGAAECEVLFYENLRAHLDIEAPVSRFAAVDTTSLNALIVMDDVAAGEVTFCDHTTTVTRANVESQMTLLGRMHGTSYASPTIKDLAQRLPTGPGFFANTLAFGMREGSPRRDSGRPST